MDMALDTHTGATIWENEDKNYGGLYRQDHAIFANDIYYVHRALWPENTSNGEQKGETIIAYNSTDGRVLWSLPRVKGVAINEVTSLQNIYATTKLLFYSQQNEVHAVDAQTGQPVWTMPDIPTPGSFHTDETTLYLLAPHQPTVLIPHPADGSPILAFSQDQGKLLWTSAEKQATALTVSSTHIYASTTQKQLLVYDSASRQIQHTFSIPEFTYALFAASI